MSNTEEKVEIIKHPAPGEEERKIIQVKQRENKNIQTVDRVHGHPSTIEERGK